MSGQFLHPAVFALGGLLAVAPIILHLIMKQQPRRLEFPALRFVLARKDANRRSLRLRHLILLALRVLAVLFLGAALARPRIKSSGGIADQEAPVAAAIIFDTSPRMDYFHENVTRLEAAKAICQEFLPRLPKDSSVAIVDGTRSEPAFQTEMGATKERIARLATSPVARPLWESVEAASRLLEKSDLERREIYVFTDRSAAAWEVEPASRLQQALAGVENLGAYAIDVGAERPLNFSLGDIRLESQVLARDRPWTLHVEVAAAGAEGQRAVEAYLFGPLGAPEKKGQETLTLASGETASVAFPISGLPAGTHQGYVQILGSDALACDDRRFFTVEVKPPRRILVAAPSPADERAYDFVQTLADDESRAKGRNRFECEVVSYDELRRKVLDESLAAACLLDPPPLAEAVWSSLRDFVSAGSGLAIVLGPEVRSIDKFHQPAALELLPGELSLLARDPTGKLLPDTERVEHPLLAAFKPLKGEAIWTGLPVFKYWRFKNLAAGSAPIVPLSNRQPLLIERPVGKGRVLTFATSLAEADDTDDRDRWNRFQTGLDRWPYHMLVNEMMLYLTGSSDSRVNYLPGQIAVLKLDPTKKFATYLVSRPDGEPLRLAADAAQRSMTLANTEAPGNYRVRAGAGEAGVDLGLSVNLPASATRLDRLSLGELEVHFGDVPHAVLRSQDEINRTVQAGRVGVELFPLLMIVLTIVMACEHVAANRFYRERPA